MAVMLMSALWVAPPGLVSALETRVSRPRRPAAALPRAAVACSAASDDGGGGGGGGAPDERGGESDALAAFRKQLQRQMSGEGGASASPLGRAGPADLWASPRDSIEPGVVLLADYTRWVENKARRSADVPFDQFALRGPLPADLPPDMVARVLPVVILLAKGADGSHDALLLERRTGILLGDIKGNEYACAPINALLFGGTAARESVQVLAQYEGRAAPAGLTSLSPGIGFGPWSVAKQHIEQGTISGSRSFVFAGKTVFGKGELERQMAADLWKAAYLSRDVLFKERSEPSMRKGSIPLWREALELCDGEHAQVVKELYGDEL